MKKFAKGVVSGAAGLSAFGIGFGMAHTSEITNAEIEACADALRDAEKMPEACYSTFSVFPTSESTQMAITRSGEEPFPITIVEPILLDPEEYRQKAYELQDGEPLKSPLARILASVAVGGMVGSVMYYEWVINTPERRGINSTPPAQ